MACVHLNQLYQLCKDSQVRLSSSDLIHIVCKQCEKEEVCPSVLFEAYDSHELEVSRSKESQSESQSRQSD